MVPSTCRFIAMSLVSRSKSNPPVTLKDEQNKARVHLVEIRLVKFLSVHEILPCPVPQKHLFLDSKTVSKLVFPSPKGEVTINPLPRGKRDVYGLFGVINSSSTETGNLKMMVKEVVPFLLLSPTHQGLREDPHQGVAGCSCCSLGFLTGSRVSQ